MQTSLPSYKINTLFLVVCVFTVVSILRLTWFAHSARRSPTPIRSAAFQCSEKETKQAAPLALPVPEGPCLMTWSAVHQPPVRGGCK